MFVVKVATSFYDNNRHGLPSSNGLMLVLSATTGVPLALLREEGWLTDARTAAAGVLAVEAAHPGPVGCLGVIGAGIQAEMQARWIWNARTVAKVVVWARQPDAARALAARLAADGIAAEAARDVAILAALADVTVTTTPATQPVLSANQVRAGTVIVAMGADTYGKQELDTDLIAAATSILCDDIAQCLDHGEVQSAERSGGSITPEFFCWATCWRAGRRCHRRATAPRS